MKLRSSLSLAALLATLPAATPSATAAPAVNEARALVQAGKVPDALAKLEAALRNATGADKTALALELARTQVSAGLLITALQTAETSLREASATDPQRPALAYLTARLYEANLKPDDALSLQRSLADQKPAVPERADALAAALRIVTPSEHNLVEFTTAFPQDPRSREFLLQLYRARTSVNDQRGAAETAARYKAAYPSDPAGAALSAAYHLSLAGDHVAAVTAFEAERKLPNFTLTPSLAGVIIDSARREATGATTILSIANDYERQTGDVRFQVTAAELLPALNAADQAVTLGNALLPKVANTALAPRLRVALANALWRGPKNSAEAEKLLVAVIAENPANDTAWNLYRDITAGTNRPAVYTALLEQTLTSLSSQKNLTLRLTAQSQLRYRLVQAAALARDTSAVAKQAEAFLSSDGLSANGPEVIKFFTDACFVGLPDPAKTGAEADAARAAFETRFDRFLPAVETYLTRTIAWGPSLDAVNDTLKPRLTAKPLAASHKKLNELLARVRQHSVVKASLDFQRLRTIGTQANRIPSQAERLLPQFLNGSNALALEGGNELINVLSQARQWEKVVDACRLYFEKNPGATGPLPALATAIQQVGAPKNAALVPVLTDALAKAGSNPWPYESLWFAQTLFGIAEQNRDLPAMIAQLKVITALQPADTYDYQRRLGVVQAAVSDPATAKTTLLAAAKAAQLFNADAPALVALANALPPTDADALLPLIDAYLVRPNRGPQQTAVQVVRGHLLLTGKNDAAGALAALTLAAARPADLAWGPGNLPVAWIDTLLQPVLAGKIEAAKPADLQLLSDAVAVTRNPALVSALMLRQGAGNQPLEFAENLNRVTAAQNPKDNNALSGNYLPWSRQLTALDKPELAGLVLRSAVTRFTDVNASLRAQASQTLFSLGSKSGFQVAEIDEKLEWAPLLKAAASFRNGDPVAAWQGYQENEALFNKNEDKLPADFLRWVSERLLQRDDEPSRDKAEKILRTWIIANENATGVPAEEKARTQLQLADVYFKTLRYDLARSECVSLINRFPGTPQATEAQFRIGECFLNQKMYSDAAKTFEGLAKSREKAIASRGEFFLGVLAQQRGDTEDAKARFRNVMDLGPSKDVADAILYRLSELYGQENRFSDELTLLRSIGIIGSSAKLWHSPGMPLNIVIQDADLGVSRGQSYVPVEVTTSSGDREVARLESGSAGKGFFRAELPTELGDPKPGDHILQINGADVITYDYPADFKKQFTAIAPPLSDIRLASDADFRISATEIKEEEEISFEERLREQRRLAGKTAGLEFRQEFRKGNDLKPGNNIYLQVKDADRDISKGPDTVNVLVTAASGGRISAKLTETGPHTGVFRGVLPTIEVSANVFASDRSSGNDAVRAIDGNPKSSWEGLNDGRAPKFIVVDLKQPTKLGRFTWASDPALKDKIPLEYGVQVSNDLLTWTTVAATSKFTASTDALAKRITRSAAPDGSTQAAIDLTGGEGRYVRLFIEKFSGSAPRLSEISVEGADNVVLVPAKTGPAEAAANDGIRLTPSDRVTAAYEDAASMISNDKPRSLSQQLQATYYNGKIGFIAYEFVPVQGRSEPERFIKQVRRAEPGQRIIVSITDYDADLSDKRDKVKFVLRTSDGQETVMEAVETEPFTGVFTKEFDLWSEKKPNGFKLDPGVTLEARYLDGQNTDPGAAIQRFAFLEASNPGDVKVAFIPSTVETDRAGKQRMVYTPAPSTTPAGTIKSVAFLPPLTFEIIDPAAARDSFSEITAVLTTSGGSRVEVICPLSSIADGGRSKPGNQVDQALEAGRFVGQIFLNLGDKDSPATRVLELGDTRTLIQRRGPATSKDPQMANVVPVLNLNGQDIITVTYEVNGRAVTDQARLAVPPSVEFTDNSYEKPASELYIGDKVYVSVKDLTADATAGADSIDVTLTSPRGEKFTARLLETLSHSGEFTGSFPLVAGEKPVPGDARMEAWFGDTLKLAYTGGGAGAAPIEKAINVVKGTDATLLVFEKKYATEQVAIESQFRMAEAYFELFKNYRTLKQDAQAETSLAEGMQLLKELREDYPSKAYEARTDYLLGQFAQELKKYDEAITYYRRIVSNHSDHPLAPDAQYKLGQCQEEKGDMDAASAEYVTLAYTWPENPLVANVIVRISEYFYNKKEFPAAAAVAKKFVERFPQHEWAERMLFRAAQCHFKADQFVEAGEAFDLLVENYPRGRFRPDAMFWAGESYRSAKQMENAFRRYKRVTWDYPESDAAKFARGKLVLPEMVNMSDKDVAQ